MNDKWKFFLCDRLKWFSQWSVRNWQIGPFANALFEFFLEGALWRLEETQHPLKPRILPLDLIPFTERHFALLENLVALVLIILSNVRIEIAPKVEVIIIVKGRWRMIWFLMVTAHRALTTETVELRLDGVLILIKINTSTLHPLLL